MNGVRSGNATTAAGKFNNAGTFDGVDDNAVISVEGSPADVGSTTDSYSFAVWFNSTMDCNNAALQCIIAGKDDGSGAYPYKFDYTLTERVEFKFSDGTNTISTFSPSGVSYADGRWHLAVGIRDVAADTISLYVDGKLLDSQTDTTTATMDNADSISFGNGGSGYTERDYSGLIDDVRFYNYPLNAAQVNLLYNDGAAVRWGP